VAVSASEALWRFGVYLFTLFIVTGRTTGLAHPSVCSVRPPNSKTKIDVNVPLDTSNQCANLQFIRSKVRVRVRVRVRVCAALARSAA